MPLQVLSLHVNHYPLNDIDHEIRLFRVQLQIITFQIVQESLALSYIIPGNDLSRNYILGIVDRYLPILLSCQCPAEYLLIPMSSWF